MSGPSEPSSRAAGPDGLLLIDKPAGITSHDVVDRVRVALGTRKVGHAGTLDPIATGLLLLGVGRATRLLRFLSDLGKTYVGTGLLGQQTDTLDADGTVVATHPVDVDEEDVRVALGSMEGASEQRPPAYSAVKVGGRPLYEAARAGEIVSAPPRPIVVERFELLGFDHPSFSFSVTCSSGTYVRVLVADAGLALGCGAHLTRLERTAIGRFEVADAAPPDAPGALLPLAAAVAHLPRIPLTADEAVAASHGRILGPAGIEGPYGAFAPTGALVGIYRDEGSKARPEVILAPA